MKKKLNKILFNGIFIFTLFCVLPVVVIKAEQYSLQCETDEFATAGAGERYFGGSKFAFIPLHGGVQYRIVELTNITERQEYVINNDEYIIIVKNNNHCYKDVYKYDGEFYLYARYACDKTVSSVSKTIEKDIYDNYKELITKAVKEGFVYQYQANVGKQYFCVEKERPISYANNYAVAWNATGKTNNNIKCNNKNSSGTCSFEDEALYAGLGRLIYEYINNSSIINSSVSRCNINVYYNIQQLIHLFMKEIGGGTYDVTDEYWVGSSVKYRSLNSANTYVSKYKDIYQKAVNDYDYYKYTDDNIILKDSSGTEINTLKFTKKGDNYIADVLISSDGYVTSYDYEIKIGNTLYQSDKNVNEIHISIPTNYFNNQSVDLELKVTANRNFYLIKEHYKTWSGNKEYQQLISSEVVPEKKAITKTISGTLKLAPAKLKLSKYVKGTNSLIYSDDVKVALYSGSNCNASSLKQNIVFTGSETITLDAGNYSLKEITAPYGYQLDNTCHNFTMSNGATTEVKIENTAQCVSEVAAMIESNTLSRQALVNLYKKYPQYNNLLNFTVYSIEKPAEENAKSFCSNTTCSNSLIGSCLSVSSENSFNANNWACHNSTVDLNGNIGYCYLDFNFKKSDNISINSDYIGKNITAGQFVFKSDSIGSGTLSKTCYFANTPTQTSISDDSYDSYISSVEFNGVQTPDNPSKQLIIYKNQTNSQLKGDANGDLYVDVLDAIMILKYDAAIGSITNSQNADFNGDGKITSLDVSRLLQELNKGLPVDVNKFYGSVTVNYLTNKIYVEKLSGRLCSDPTDLSCIHIGNGLISNFNSAYKAENIDLLGDNFHMFFKVNFANKNIFGKASIGGDCLYTVHDEVITYDNSGNGKLELEFRTIDTNKPFNRKTNTNWCAGSDCSAYNDRVIDYITKDTVNNSYNRTGDGPIYRIELTPSLIQQIRGYNETHPYDDYELSCNANGQNCGNAFLKEFSIVKK